MDHATDGGCKESGREPGALIEYVRAPFVGPEPVVRPRGVLFDFDGTLSLVREGWTELMVSLAVEELAKLHTNETVEELTSLCHEFVTRLTGKPTIYQMHQLAEEVRRRKGTPSDPLVYQERYHQRLIQRTGQRRESLKAGRDLDRYLVPGSRELLAYLRDRDVTLYLASGTNETDVREELELLRIDEFFGPRVWGARPDRPDFTKGWVVRGPILQDDRIAGRELLGFGDGVVESQELCAVQGVAVAVASDESCLVHLTDEERRSSSPTFQRVDAWKRERLIAAGAHVVVPDYRGIAPLLAKIF